MSPDELKVRVPAGELIISASRSGGPGGQNVNKVSTKIELRFHVRNSSSLSEDEKEKIMTLLKNRINSEGELIIISQSERSQLMNRKKAEEKFYKLLASALTVRRERKATAPSAASRIERLEKKKMRGQNKKLRKDTGFEDK